jgi:hypothetical protein
MTSSINNVTVFFTMSYFPLAASACGQETESDLCYNISRHDAKTCHIIWVHRPSPFQDEPEVIHSVVVDDLPSIV